MFCDSITMGKTICSLNHPAVANGLVARTSKGKVWYALITFLYVDILGLSRYPLSPPTS